MFNKEIYNHTPQEELLDVWFGGAYAKGRYNFMHTAHPGTIMKEWCPFWGGLLPTESNDVYTIRTFGILRETFTQDLYLTFVNMTYEPWKEKCIKECHEHNPEYLQTKKQWELYVLEGEVLERFNRWPSI